MIRVAALVRHQKDMSALPADALDRCFTCKRSWAAWVSLVDDRSARTGDTLSGELSAISHRAFAASLLGSQPKLVPCLFELIQVGGVD
jgi:hypothetical protein